MKTVFNRVSLWNLFIGMVIGFGLGVFVVNALIPNANDLIRIYQMDKKSTQINQGEQR